MRSLGKYARPLIITLLLLAIAASVAYWIPRLRDTDTPPVATPAATQSVPGATVALFGARPQATLATANVQITGVVVADDPAQSMVIVAESGRPARAVRAGATIGGGLRIAEVHRRHVVLTDGTQTARVDIPERAVVEAGGGLTGTPPAQESPAPAAPEVQQRGRGEPPHRTGTPEEAAQANAPPGPIKPEAPQLQPVQPR